MSGEDKKVHEKTMEERVKRLEENLLVMEHIMMHHQEALIELIDIAENIGTVSPETLHFRDKAREIMNKTKEEVKRG